MFLSILLLAIIASVTAVSIFTCQKSEQHSEKRTGRERLEEKRRHEALEELKSTMDPTLAAHIYNKTYPPLFRLPDELILMILCHLSTGSDWTALHSLRRVSRRLERIVFTPVLWRNLLGDGQANSLLAREKWSEEAFKAFQVPQVLPSKDALRLHRLTCSLLRNLLKRDRSFSTCKRCLQHPDMRIGRVGCEFINWGGDSGTKMAMSRVGAHSEERLHCSGCGVHHPTSAFSPFRAIGGPEERICLGREGAVRLCEHVEIRWTDIESHVRKWQKQWRNGKLGEKNEWNWWNRCINDFHIECHDPSHSAGCADVDVETWPQARLNTFSNSKQRDHAILVLKWQPHSGTDYFTTPGPAAKGSRLSAEEMRALFHRYRKKGAANILFPSFRTCPEPEMACFGHSSGCKGDCLEYDHAAIMAASSTSTPTAETTAPGKGPGPGPLSWWKFQHCNNRLHRHTYSRGHPGKNQTRVSVHYHQPSPPSSSQISTRHTDTDPKKGHKKQNPKHKPKTKSNKHCQTNSNHLGPKPCLITTYTRHIHILSRSDFFQSKSRSRHLNTSRPLSPNKSPSIPPILPSHEWFHSMCPTTYPAATAGPSSTSSSCPNPTCENYHRKPVFQMCHATACYPHARSCRYRRRRESPFPDDGFGLGLYLKCECGGGGGVRGVTGWKGWWKGKRRRTPWSAFPGVL